MYSNTYLQQMLKLMLLNFVSCFHGNALFQREGMTLDVRDEVGGGGGGGVRFF